MSGAAYAPAAFYGDEDFGEFFDEGGLLLGGEHEVAVALFGGGEGGENAVAYAEVGAAHVGGFFGAFEARGRCGGSRRCSWRVVSVKTEFYPRLERFA